jgi:hypothetical protein
VPIDRSTTWARGEPGGWVGWVVAGSRGLGQGPLAGRQQEGHQASFEAAAAAARARRACRRAPHCARRRGPPPWRPPCAETRSRPTRARARHGTAATSSRRRPRAPSLCACSGGAGGWGGAARRAAGGGRRCRRRGGQPLARRRVRSPAGAIGPHAIHGRRGTRRALCMGASGVWIGPGWGRAARLGCLPGLKRSWPCAARVVSRGPAAGAPAVGGAAGAAPRCAPPAARRPLRPLCPTPAPPRPAPSTRNPAAGKNFAVRKGQRCYAILVRAPRRRRGASPGAALRAGARPGGRGAGPPALTRSVGA